MNTPHEVFERDLWKLGEALEWLEIHAPLMTEEDAIELLAISARVQRLAEKANLVHRSVTTEREKANTGTSVRKSAA